MNFTRFARNSAHHNSQYWKDKKARQRRDNPQEINPFDYLYIPIPRWLTPRGRLRPEIQKTYGFYQLCFNKKKGYAHPGEAYTLEQRKISRSALYRHNKRLEQLRLIKIVKRDGKKVIVFLEHEWQDGFEKTKRALQEQDDIASLQEENARLRAELEVADAHGETGEYDY